MKNIRDKVRNREIHYNDISKANFDLIPLFLNNDNIIKFKSYNELIHTIILLYLYVGSVYNTEVTVIDTLSCPVANKTYSSYVNPITASPLNIINKLRGQIFKSNLIIFIKAEAELEPVLEDNILNAINIRAKGKANIITCVL